MRARQAFGHLSRDGKSKDGDFFWKHRWDLCSTYDYGFNPVHANYTIRARFMLCAQSVHEAYIVFVEVRHHMIYTFLESA